MGANQPVAARRAAGGPADAPRAVTLLCDADRRRQEEFVAQAEQALRAREPGLELLRFYGFDEKTAVAGAFREINSDSLFAARKLIVVTAAEKFLGQKGGGLEPLRQYLAAPNPNVTIILRTENPEKELSAGVTKLFTEYPALTAIIACRPSAAGEAAAVRKWFADAGLAIAADAAARLGELRAADADGLLWCLERLRDGAVNGAVTRADVERAVAGEGEGNLFGFVDAVGARQPAALAQLEVLLRDEHPLPLLALVRTRIRDLAIIREMQQAGRTENFIAQSMGKTPWLLGRIMPQAGHWQAAELRRALVVLGELNGELRGVGDRLAPTVFLRGIARVIMRPAA